MFSTNTQAENDDDNSELAINIPRIQQQKETDCSLFTIAFAVHAALGDDLTLMMSQMRPHLVNCLRDVFFPVLTIKYKQFQ